MADIFEGHNTEMIMIHEKIYPMDLKMSFDLLPITSISVLALVLSSMSLIISLPQVESQSSPTFVDDKLFAEEVARSIDFPTGMAFLGPDDLLVLEQYNGTVLRIKNGTIFTTPLLDVNVGNSSERGLLGIEIMPQRTGNPFVFLYYTEAQSNDGGKILGNRLYRYTFIDDVHGGKLLNKTLLLDLPGNTSSPTTRTIPGLEHNGGKLAIGPDNNVYLTIGDLRRKTKSQNFMSGADVDGSGGILRVTPEGKAVGNGILGTTHPLDKYFAYGIRNSFGIDFDPITGYLWITENGPAHYDEINLVKPGFNSGWQSLMGFIGEKSLPQFGPDELLRMISTHLAEAINGIITKNFTHAESHLIVARAQLENYPINSGLYSFDGKGVYSDPEFVWQNTVGPTAIKFHNSSKLGDEYLDRMFVGDSNTGRILSFALNTSRTGLDLSGNLSDNVANSIDETNPVLFGSGFGVVTDLVVGPDGHLYVLRWDTGTIYRIMYKL